MATDDEADPVFVPYTASQRAIYRFDDGSGKPRAVDPLGIIRKLGEVEGLALQPDLELSAVTDAAMRKESDDATFRLIAAAREVFGVAEWSEDADGKQSGLTDSESLSLLVNFINFYGRLAEAGAGFPNSSESTDSPAVESATASTSECGQTGGALLGGGTTI